MKRHSGVLLHLTSLPSPYGVGDLGPEAHRFLALLARGGQRRWQVLPLGPTEPGLGDSPYSSYSAFAGHSLLVSPDFLFEDGLLERADLERAALPVSGRADFQTVTRVRRSLLWRAFERAEARLLDDPEFGGFQRDNGTWLNDFALFMAAKRHFGGAAWSAWPEALRRREEAALRQWGTDLARDILFEKFCQQRFFRQWGRLRARARELNVGIIGDAPIYVTFDSADVWANQDLFKLDAEGGPRVVAGVPPDYFSATGQRWGNPVYDWPAHERTGFDWWLRRMRHNCDTYDIIRLDHFRGFEAYWEIPALEPTAINGKWVSAPGLEMFKALARRHPALPIVAEDLGLIDAEVREVKRLLGLPGMAILMFAFGEDNPANPYLPHNHRPDLLVYTGTHDNNTLRGWLAQEAEPETKERIRRYLGRPGLTDPELAQAMIRLALASVAELAVLPVQDVLGLGAEARMNTPSRRDGNWTWRLQPGQLGPDQAQALWEMAGVYGRR
jgi:4-alpha-glucanotransferase